MDAYDFYLRGRYFIERGDIDFAIDMFEKAIELDDDYALAWAGAADCYSWKNLWFEESAESLKKADECSRKALQLAPDLAEAHASRSYALGNNGKYSEAEAEFKSAIDLDPQLFEAYYYAGRSYFAEGKFRKAVDAFAQAGAIRPDDVSAATMRSNSLNNVGTEEECRKAAEHSVKVAERYLALNPDDVLALSRAANDLISLGEKDKGIEWAERAYSLNPHICRYNVACALNVAGKTERALDLLEIHAKAEAISLDWLTQDGDWDTARDHPRFKAILESLSQYAVQAS
jgi:adenylate cyclase